MIDKDALSYDPLSVEMTRSGYPSIFPCRSGFPKLDIDQLEWSINHGWWFTGPVKTLKITDIKKEKLSKADIDLLKRLAKKGDFILKID